MKRYSALKFSFSTPDLKGIIGFLNISRISIHFPESVQTDEELTVVTSYHNLPLLKLEKIGSF